LAREGKIADAEALVQKAYPDLAPESKEYQTAMRSALGFKTKGALDMKEKIQVLKMTDEKVAADMENIVEKQAAAFLTQGGREFKAGNALGTYREILWDKYYAQSIFKLTGASITGIPPSVKKAAVEDEETTSVPSPTDTSDRATAAAPGTTAPEVPRGTSIWGSFADMPEEEKEERKAAKKKRDSSMLRGRPY